MKAYHDGQYLDSDELNPERLKDILKGNLKKYEYIATKFGWKINNTENESINQRTTKEKRGQKR